MSRESIRSNLTQIIAITEKNIKLQKRFRLNLIISFITPVIFIIMPIIIMGFFFELNAEFGPWTAQNFLIYQFIAYNIILLRGIIISYPSHFQREKYWQTLPGLIIAPFNRLNLLFGIFISNIILISIPFTFFIIICYIYSPISIFTILFVLLIYLFISIIFSGIGLILGIFAISNENIMALLKFLINFVFYFSCVSYPFELFPGLFQDVISLNPIYYIIDFLRLTWIEDNLVISIVSHLLNFSLLIIFTMILPIIGVFIFNKIYRKYGIVGY